VGTTEWRFQPPPFQETVQGAAWSRVTKPSPPRICGLEGSYPCFLTGFQGAIYSLRTAILPFVFVFNPELLLIDIGGWLYGIWVVFISMVAILLFAAASMNWFITKSRLWESAVLLVCCFTLFRPAWWLDRFYPAHEADDVRGQSLDGGHFFPEEAPDYWNGA
jgi:hypothetical protein